MVPAIESECWPFSHRNGGLFPAGMVAGFNRNTHTTRDEARKDIVDYIEMFYNSRRRHSYLGYISPKEFEKRQLLKKAA